MQGVNTARARLGGSAMRLRRALALTGAVALLAACGGEGDVEVDDVQEPAATDEADDGGDEPVDEAPEQDPAENDDRSPSDDGSEGAQGAVADEQQGSGEDQEPDAQDSQPDPEALEAPCADHQDRTDEAFIELVSPVNEQVVADSVALVGCSNVFEGNVAWRLLDGDGETLDEGFTTAECGNGCVGAFDDEVPLDTAAGEPVAHLQVYSPNVSDEGEAEQHLVEVALVLE